MILPSINELEIIQTKLNGYNLSMSPSIIMLQKDKFNQSININQTENYLNNDVNHELKEIYCIKTSSIKYHSFMNNNLLRSSTRLSSSLSQVINHYAIQKNQNNEKLVKNENGSSELLIRKNNYSKFSLDEDLLLKNIVNKYGAQNWRFISSFLPGRTSRQCRDRYKNYLDPEIDLSNWEEEEDNLIIEKYRIYGPKWSKIANYFPKRTPNSIKNRCNYSLFNIISKIQPKNECIGI